LIAASRTACAAGERLVIGHLHITATDVVVGVFPVDALWVERVFNRLKRVPPMVAILGTTGTTPKKALVVFKSAGSDHASAYGGANGAAV
jgi:hypothetical protein